MRNHNFIFLSLENLTTKTTAKLIAENLQMIFVDLKNEISKNLIAENLIHNFDKMIADKIENETITKLLGLKNQIIFCTIDLLNKTKLLKKIKENSKIIYIKYKKQDISTDNFSYNMGYAFDTEDKFCQNISDLIIEYKKNMQIEKIIEKMRQICDKESKWQ